jgi:hypothetical protein
MRIGARLRGFVGEPAAAIALAGSPEMVAASIATVNTRA